MGLPTALHQQQRTLRALTSFLHTYNHHRCRTALESYPLISRVNNAAVNTAGRRQECLTVLHRGHHCIARALVREDGMVHA